MNRISILFIVFFAFTWVAQAEHNIMFDKANQLYHNKNYDSAAKLYQQMLDDGYISSELFYNTGNAYYRNNQIGLSIWCYKKAIELNANDKNYIENLALAKKRIKEPIDELATIFFIRWWNYFYQLFSVNAWAILALSIFLIAFLILFINKFTSRVKLPNGLAILLFSMSAISLLMMLYRSYQEINHYHAILIEPKTMITFQSKGEPMFLSDGIEVIVVDKEEGINRTMQSNYIKVKLPDGRIGRVSKSAIKKL